MAPAAVLLVVVLLVAPCDAQLARRGRSVTQGRRLLPAPMVRSEASKKADKVLAIVQPALERKFAVEQLLGIELDKLAAEIKAPDNNASKHEMEVLVRQRKLRMRVLNEMQASILQQVKLLSELAMKPLHNFTATLLHQHTQDQLDFIQEQSALAAEAVKEASELEKEEKNDKAQRKPKDGSVVSKVIAKVDEEVGKAVGAVEKELSTDAAWAKARWQGAEIETVVKVSENGHHQHAEDTGIVSTLVDHQDNRYVLSKPRDSSVHYEDTALIRDIVCMIIASFLGGLAAQTWRLPLFFGYIVGGVLLSPTELNVLKNLVQIETISQFGVYLLLFLLGVEFSVDKVRAVWKPAMLGGIAGMVVVWVISEATITGVFHAKPAEGILVGFCASLSSTAVVLKLLTGDEAGTFHGQLLVAVLVVQDVFLGIMVAMVPVLDHFEAEGFRVVAQMTVHLMALAAVCLILVKFISARFLSFINKTPELFILGLTATCFGVMVVTDELALSMEVGCFATGVVFSAAGKDWALRIETALRPLQDFLGALFFASIGIHIYPSFLLREAVLLVFVTISIVFIKWLVGLVIFKFLCGKPTLEASIVALGLSQLSEFSFVIAAHGKSQGLINREVYFMLIGITALSLTTTPILWRFHPKVPDLPIAYSQRACSPTTAP